MGPSSIIYLTKNYITSFNSPECHLWLYQCFRSEIYYSKSFASNFQIQCITQGSIYSQFPKPKIKYIEQTISKNDLNQKKKNFK